MGKYAVYQNIGDYKIGLNILFSSYSKSDFDKDLQQMLDYQRKIGLSKDKHERAQEVDMKFYEKLKSTPDSMIKDVLTYEYFRKTCFGVIAKMFFL